MSRRVKGELIPKGHLTLQEHVKVITEKQLRVKEAVWDYIQSIRVAFDQLGSDVFDSELAKELGMTSSTLNRWKSISLSEVVVENRDQLPPVFSSLYQVTLLEKQYKDFYGPSRGVKKIQSLINRRSINPNTETKDITFFVDQVKRERLDQKRLEKEQYLLDQQGSVGYEVGEKYSSIQEMVEQGVKVRTIVVSPPQDLLTKWSDMGFSSSDIDEEFPVSELRGRSEVQSINYFVVVPNSRVDVGLKILRSGGFSFRQIFYPNHEGYGFSGERSQPVVVYGQRGMGGSVRNVSSTDTSLEGVCQIAEQIGEGPFLVLFGENEREGWLSVTDPI